MKTLSASELKARLLAVLDEVARTGEIVVVTKRGREVARLVGPARSAASHPQDELEGTVQFHGDVLAPPLDADEWSVLCEADRVAEKGGSKPASSKRRRRPRG